MSATRIIAEVSITFGLGYLPYCWGQFSTLD